MPRVKVAIVGPVFPFRAGIAYCTTRLAEELRKGGDVDVISFSRQFPKRFYPGGHASDVYNYYGMAVGPGIRFSGKRWGIDFALYRGLGSGSSSAVPLLVGTYRFLP